MSDSTMTYSSAFPPPPPSLFTIPSPTNNSDDGSFKETVIIVVAIVAVCVIIFVIKKFWKKFKDGSKGTGVATESDAFGIDLESGLYGREGGLKRKSERGKKSVKKIHDHGDMVHGYDKRLSSSKVGANYYAKSKNAKFGAIHREPTCVSDEDSESECDNISLDSDVDNMKRSNADKGHKEFSSESKGHLKLNLEDESHSEDSGHIKFSSDSGHVQFSSKDESSSEEEDYERRSSEEEDYERRRGLSSKDKKIRNKKPKQVKNVKDIPKYNDFKGDAESGYYNKRLSRSKDEAFRSEKSKKRRAARAGRPE